MQAQAVRTVRALGHGRATLQHRRDQVTQSEAAQPAHAYLFGHKQLRKAAHLGTHLLRTLVGRSECACGRGASIKPAANDHSASANDRSMYTLEQCALRGRAMHSTCTVLRQPLARRVHMCRLQGGVLDSKAAAGTVPRSGMRDTQCCKSAALGGMSSGRGRNAREARWSTAWTKWFSMMLGRKASIARSGTACDHSTATLRVLFSWYMVRSTRSHKVW